MPWVMLAMAAMKAQEDSTRNNNAAQLKAAEQKYAPYTHHDPGYYDPQKAPSALATLAQGGVAGWQMNQNMDAAEQARKLNDARIAYYSRGGGADALTKGAAGTGAGGAGFETPEFGQSAPGYTDGSNPWSLGADRQVGGSSNLADEMDASTEASMMQEPSLWEQMTSYGAGAY